MPRNLFDVVEEFRRSGELQYRKNAVTALAILADEKGTSQLAEAALTDPEPSVRERAEQEMLTLGPVVQSQAIDALKRALEDKKLRQAAYAILGRLRGNGLHVKFWRSPLPTWIRLNVGLNSYLYPLRNWSFRTRSWKTGLWGGVLAIAFLSVFFLRTGRLEDYGGFTATSVGLLFLSPLMSMLANQRTTPINLYLDHLLGFLTEVLCTGVLSNLGMVVCLILFAFVGGGAYYLRNDASVFLVPLIVGVFVALVRTGTIISYGRFTDKRKNRIAQLVIGVATGFVALTIANYFGWRRDPLNHSSGVLWVTLLPLSFVTANSFSAIDNQSSPIRPFIGRVGTALCILVLVPSVVLAGIVFNLGRNAYDTTRGPTLDRVFEMIKTGEINPSQPSHPTP